MIITKYVEISVYFRVIFNRRARRRKLVNGELLELLDLDVSSNCIVVEFMFPSWGVLGKWELWNATHKHAIMSIFEDD
jgi:hypothetical protein